ncbi:hypothetical protein K438DRAFT_816133 [Mycena galopus ATCC 62051]|nr:hypothetical protein K438DRAFT_816133 [Mycena galopus ATCC 62051]
MANILARFRRGRTTSLAGTPALTPPGPTLPTIPAPAPTVPQAQSPPLEGKIHPDLDSLVANWSPPVDHVSSATSAPEPASPPFSTALRPSTRRHSIDGVTPVFRPPPSDTNLEGLPEVSVPIPFTAQAQPSTRTRRLITRLTGASSPPSSSTNLATTSVAGWSTFGRRAKKGGDSSRPHLTEFGERGRGSPAPSQGTSVSHSHSVSQSRSPSQVNLGTPSTTSQQLDDSVSNSDHGHPTASASELPSPSSGFTFGSQHRLSARGEGSPVPPMPPLDHPAFRGPGKIPHSTSASRSHTPSQLQLPQLPREARRPRSSSSLPSMHSTSRRKRQAGANSRAKAQDVFASLLRPGSARRRSSAEFGSSQVSPAPGSHDVVFLALAASGEREGKRTNLTDQIGPESGDLCGGDFKFDTRAERVLTLSLCSL